MRLSEAIRLGSLAIQNPKAGDSRYCAIGMGLEAIGQRDVIRESANYRKLTDNWTWMASPQMRRDRLTYPPDFVWQMFDGQVMATEPTMTLEQLCDQVRAWEGELAAKGINVEQVTMAAELNQPASQAAKHIPELDVELEQDVAK